MGVGSRLVLDWKGRTGGEESGKKDQAEMLSRAKSLFETGLGLGIKKELFPL